MAIVVPATLPLAIQAVNGNITTIWFNDLAPTLDVRMQTWISDFFAPLAPSGSFPLPLTYSFIAKTILISDLLTPAFSDQDQSGIFRASEVVVEALAAAIQETNFAANPGGGVLLQAFINAWT